MSRASVAAALALLALAGCGGTDARDEASGTRAQSTPRPAKVVKLTKETTVRQALAIPARCPQMDVVLFCDRDPGPRDRITLVRTPQLTNVLNSPGAAFGLGGALTAHGKVVLRGHSRSGAVYIMAFSGPTVLAAAFHQLGLEGASGTAAVTLRCLSGNPVAVLRQPDGDLVGPDVQGIYRGPDAAGNKPQVPDVCRPR